MSNNSWPVPTFSDSEVVSTQTKKWDHPALSRISPSSVARSVVMWADRSRVWGWESSPQDSIVVIFVPGSAFFQVRACQNKDRKTTGAGLWLRPVMKPNIPQNGQLCSTFIQWIPFLMFETLNSCRRKLVCAKIMPNVGKNLSWCALLPNFKKNQKSKLVSSQIRLVHFPICGGNFGVLQRHKSTVYSRSFDMSRSTDEVQ